MTNQWNTAIPGYKFTDWDSFALRGVGSNIISKGLHKIQWDKISGWRDLYNIIYIDKNPKTYVLVGLYYYTAQEKDTECTILREIKEATKTNKTVIAGTFNRRWPSTYQLVNHHKGTRHTLTDCFLQQLDQERTRREANLSLVLHNTQELVQWEQLTTEKIY